MGAASRRRPWMPFYLSDWEESIDVQTMTPEAECCYWVLCRKAWRSEDGGIPDDDAAIQSLLGKFGGWWAASAEAVRRKFESRDGKLYNPRIVTELNRMKGIAVKNKRNATKRWKCQKDATALRPHSMSHSDRNATHTNTTTSAPSLKEGGAGVKEASKRRWDGYL